MKSFLQKLKSRVITNKSGALSNLGIKDRELIAQIRLRNLTYLSDKRLASIVEVIRSVEKNSLPGAFIEAGCALAGSTILISSIKNQNRAFYVYDVFAIIPAPSEKDGQDVHDRFQAIIQRKSKGIGGDNYYGYEENLYKTVQANLRSFGIDEMHSNISLIKGLLQDTLQVEQPIAFAHIDVDWYDSVKTCLERIIPKLVVGGSIIIDDYWDWSGCRAATDEYFKDKGDIFRMDDSAGSMKIMRIKRTGLCGTSPHVGEHGAGES